MAQKNWFTPSKLLVIAGIILLGLLVWRFSSIVAYILIASVLSLIARPLVRLLGMLRIGKWKIPASIRALVTLVVIWTVLFSFFRLFIPLIASEAQELSKVDTALVVEEFEEPIQHLELWFSKLNIGGLHTLSLRDELQKQISSVLNIRLITDLVATIASILGNVAWAIFANLFYHLFPAQGGEVDHRVYSYCVPQRQGESVPSCIGFCETPASSLFCGDPLTNDRDSYPGYSGL